LVECYSCHISLNNELADKGNLHSGCFSPACLIREESKDLLATTAADIFVLEAEGGDLSVVDLHFGNNTA
jgi:hypothetical protein